MQTPPLLVTVAEASKILAVSRSRLYELIREGRIGAVKIGASTRIPYGELEKFVATLLDEAI